MIHLKKNENIHISAKYALSLLNKLKTAFEIISLFSNIICLTNFLFYVLLLFIGFYLNIFFKKSNTLMHSSIINSENERIL